MAGENEEDLHEVTRGREGDREGGNGGGERGREEEEEEKVSNSRVHLSGIALPCLSALCLTRDRRAGYWRR
jgi:hypothetical protein